MKLLNKVALITGGSRGIGKAIVEKFVEEGARVAFTYIANPDKAAQLESEIAVKINSKNSNKAISSKEIVIKAYKCDASNYLDTESLLEKIISDFGSLDILVNNAGITKDGLIVRMSENDWDNVISTNLKSVYNTTKIAGAIFMKQRHGVIVNISSIIGIKGNGGQSNYAASKAGIIGFSKSIAIELGPRNVRCNVIAPGWTDTDMTKALPDKYKEEILKYIPLRKIGQPEDIADGALFLSSEASKYITGQVLQIDGGILT